MGFWGVFGGALGATRHPNPGFCLPRGPKLGREGAPHNLPIFLRTDLGVPECRRGRPATLQRRFTPIELTLFCPRGQDAPGLPL